MGKIMGAKITGAMKDCTKMIFSIEENGSTAKTTNLAKLLHIKPASVTEMIQKLASKRILTHKPYREIKLTKEGEDIAMDFYRRHGLIEKLFVDFLGLDIASACEEASKLELLLSDYTVNCICIAFKHPTTSPCGKQIFSEKKCCGRHDA
jgi:DtxR family Mn-dependent transcriptional regulator